MCLSGLLCAVVIPIHSFLANKNMFALTSFLKCSICCRYWFRKWQLRSPKRRLARYCQHVRREQPGPAAKRQGAGVGRGHQHVLHWGQPGQARHANRLGWDQRRVRLWLDQWLERCRGEAVVGLRPIRRQAE